jgi:hypothetical protein
MGVRSVSQIAYCGNLRSASRFRNAERPLKIWLVVDVFLNVEPGCSSPFRHLLRQCQIGLASLFNLKSSPLSQSRIIRSTGRLDVNPTS